MNDPKISLSSEAQKESAAPHSQPGSTAAYTPAHETITDRDAIKPSTTFGRYILLKLLGKGGMGEVHLARDTLLERTVALKLPRFYGESEIERERFLREAKAAALLSHPNICPLHDVGEVEGRPYLTMAYIDGPSLSRQLRKNGPLPPREAAALVRTLALAMQKAHEQGILHRDLKPGNILLDAKGEPIVMDFGLAYRFDVETDDERLTQKGLLIGTPAYMPPEQINASPLGPTADVYSLGVVLFETLTGKLPFSGTLGQLIQQVEMKVPPRPATLRPGIDPALEVICLKALAKKPGERYLTMAALATALEEYLSGESQRTLKRSRRKLAALVLTLMLLTAGGVLLAVNPWRVTPVERTEPEEYVEPPLSASEREKRLAEIRDQMFRPLLKVQKFLPSSTPTLLSRATLPPEWLKDHPGPLLFEIKGAGKGHVIDLTDQPGQSAQVSHFRVGDITFRGPYILFVGNLGEGAHLYVEAPRPLGLLVCLNGGEGSSHVEFDGSHFLLPKVNPPKIQTAPISPDEKKTLRKRSLTHKVTMQYEKTTYTIYARADVQIVQSSDPKARARDFPEIHELLDADRERQMHALTVSDFNPKVIRKP